MEVWLSARPVRSHSPGVRRIALLLGDRDRAVELLREARSQGMISRCSFTLTRTSSRSARVPSLHRVIPILGMSQPAPLDRPDQGAFLRRSYPRLSLRRGSLPAALDGRLRDWRWSARAGGVVVVVQEANGQRWQATSDAGGRYLVEHLPPGGPYTVEARAIEYGPTRRTGIALYPQPAPEPRLRPDARRVYSWKRSQTLAQSPRDAGRTGPATTISDSLLARRRRCSIATCSAPWSSLHRR
jgi:hypothetical protein